MHAMKYASMEYVKQPVSRILMGGGVTPMNEGKNCDELLDAAFEAGLTTIDTARVYGESEKVLGGWLKRRGVRDKVVLLSKCAHFDPATGKKRVTPQDIFADCATSRELLGTDFIDIYLFHRDDPDVEVGPLVEAMNALVADGKVGAIGASNWTWQRICEANAYASAHGLRPFTVTSPYFGLASQIADPWGDAVSIAGPSGQQARQWYKEQNIPLIAYSPLGHGLFSGKVKGDDPEGTAALGMDEFALKGYYGPENFEKLRRVEKLAAEKGCSIPQLAMAWLLNQPLSVFPVLGTTNPARFAQNIEALSISLSEQESRWLNLEPAGNGAGNT